MTVRVKGLNEFRLGLRQADRNFGKAFGKANQKVGERVVAKGRPAIKNLPSPGGTGAQSGLKSSQKQNKAVVALVKNQRSGAILANVFGTKSHWVWGRRIEGPGPFRPWIGNRWQPEDLYGLGPAITDVMDGFALDEYLEAVLDALRPAFPD